MKPTKALLEQEQKDGWALTNDPQIELFKITQAKKIKVGKGEEESGQGETKLWHVFGFGVFLSVF